MGLTILTCAISLLIPIFNSSIVSELSESKMKPKSIVSGDSNSSMSFIIQSYPVSLYLVNIPSGVSEPRKLSRLTSIARSRYTPMLSAT